MRNHKKHTETPFDGGSLKLSMNETYEISKLSKTALKLYLFIREYSFRTNGVIFFDKNMAKGVCGFKQNKSVYNALNELVSLDIIAGMNDPNEFYYNPEFIGNEKE